MKENIKVTRKIYDVDGNEQDFSEDLFNKSCVLDFSVEPDGKIKTGDWEDLPEYVPANIFTKVVNEVCKVHNEQVDSTNKQLSAISNMLDLLENKNPYKHWTIVASILAAVEFMIIVFGG